MDVTIVIPTKNAGKLFEKVLKKVFSQETTYEYEVVCVDSGSSDNTVEIIKKFLLQSLVMGKRVIMVLQKEQEIISFLLRRMLCQLQINGFKILLMQ